MTLHNENIQLLPQLLYCRMTESFSFYTGNVTLRFWQNIRLRFLSPSHCHLVLFTTCTRFLCARVTIPVAHAQCQMLPLFFSNYAQRRQATYFAQNYAGKIYLALLFTRLNQSLLHIPESSTCLRVVLNFILQCLLLKSELLLQPPLDSGTLLGLPTFLPSMQNTGFSTDGGFAEG